MVHKGWHKCGLSQARLEKDQPNKRVRFGKISKSVVAKTISPA
jgi:hypothetical protein